MIKEIFDIEPVQKNSLIIFIGVFCLSFLQIYLFKNELLENGSLIIIGICLSLTVCWSILNVLPLFLFFHFVNNKGNIKNKSEVILEQAIVPLGYFTLGWITLLIYISYELNICFKDFIRLSIIVSILRSLFWFLYDKLKTKKT